MKRKHKLTLTLLLALSFNTSSKSYFEEEKQTIKELQFWESMKEAQKKEYRVLQARNKTLRMNQYEAMGMIRTPAAEGSTVQGQNNITLNQFVKKLQRHYNESPWDTQIEPRTGSLHIKLSELNIFEEDPRQLTENEKKRLFQFFRNYLNSVSLDDQILNKIKTIEVNVHNSPIYKGKFVPPKQDDPNNKEAYLFNMKLSQQRASEVAQVALEQQDLSLAAKLKFSGEGYRRPLKRSPAAEVVDERCEIFDCDASRRLEIRPIFK